MIPLWFIALWAFAWAFLGTCVATSILEDVDRRRTREQYSSIQWHDYKGDTAITNQTWSNYNSSGIYFDKDITFDVYGNTFTWTSGDNKT